MTESQPDKPLSDKLSQNLAQHVQAAIRTYVRQKVKKRTGKDWAAFKAAKYNDHNYRNEINKVCMDAFYQIRGRRDRREFFNYWAGIICSVPQQLKHIEPINLELLHDERWEDIQSLALAALSATSQAI